MKTYRASTKKGQALLAMAGHCCWKYLNNLYDTWSDAKQRAYDWCVDEYLKSDDHSDFGIGNANTFGFTASWLCKVDGVDCCRIETRSNSYLVVFDE